MSDYGYADAVAKTQVKNLEDALIGCFMLEPALLEELDVDENHFYQNTNRIMYRVIKRIWQKHSAVDIELVVDEVRRSESGISIAEITDFMAAAPSTAHAQVYAEKVREAAVRRRLAALGVKVIELSKSAENVDDALSKVEAELRDIAAGQESNTLHRLADLAMDAFDEIRARGGIERIKTGFYDLDYAFGGGLERGELALVAGRPSMGKTTFGVQTAANVAKEHPVLVVSMEESGRKVGLKQLARITQIPYHKISNGDFNPAELHRLADGISKLGTLSLWIDDKSHQNTRHIRRAAKQIIKQEGSLGLVVIDYLQYMVTGVRSEDVRHKVGEVAQECKIMARDLDVPVLLLAQLSRELERRNNKRPIMSDVAESGHIERHCDIMIGLYRDEVYNQPSEYAGIAEAVIMKNRDNKVGSVPLAWRGWLFDNLDLGGKREWEQRHGGRQ